MKTIFGAIKIFDTSELLQPDIDIRTVNAVWRDARQENNNRPIKTDSEVLARGCEAIEATQALRRKLGLTE